MKKFGIPLLCVLMLGLTACSLFPQYDDDEPYSASITIRETSAPTEIFFDAPVSSKDLSEQDPDNTINYKALKDLFAGVVFGGDSASVSLWKSEINYKLDGDFDQAETDVVQEFADQASRIPNFPEMREGAKGQTNLTITFESNRSYGTCSIEQDSNDNITAAHIKIPAGLKGARLKSEVERQLLKAIGLTSECQSTLNSNLAKPDYASKATDIDWMLLEFLYTETESGMTQEECEHKFEMYFTQNVQ